MNKAFFIYKKNSNVGVEKAMLHLKKISDRYGENIRNYLFNDFGLMVVGAGAVNETEKSLSFSLCIEKGKLENDRFIRIELNREGLLVTNDYAGTIPFYFSNRLGFSASNIEPCVYLASESSLEDLSAENLYGYLRYSHFIWDETAWKHIYQMIPDSTYNFCFDGDLKKRNYNRTVYSSDARFGFSDAEIADELYELNKELVVGSLSNYDEIILPLSSGYDSRLIYSVLANDKNLKNKTHCFTYGSQGSVEVEAARRLTKLKSVDWSFIDLPSRFLEKSYLSEISDIFGASLHMHGMYQLEFFRQIQACRPLDGELALTSGFMTGVPAGQHNSLLKIVDESTPLTQAMDKFPQSKVWSSKELESLPIFAGLDYLDLAESRFRQAFDRFEGDTFQKSVMFDVWTRQRNFISYYPRTLEWMVTTASPHMNPRYANFFLSIPEKNLLDRAAVELMFKRHYQDIAGIVSNSNGLKAINNPLETFAFFLSRISHKLKLNSIMPRPFANKSFEFDLASVQRVGRESFFPVFEKNIRADIFDWAGSQSYFESLFRESNGGNINAYLKFAAIQSVLIQGYSFPDA